MALRMIAGAALTLLITAAAWAGHWGAEFSQTMAVLGKNERLKVYYQARKPVFETKERATIVYSMEKRERTKKVNGKDVVEQYEVKVPQTQTVQYVVTRWVCEMRVEEIALEEVKAFETDGKPIAATALAQRLAKPTLIVQTHDGQMLPANLAAVFKPGTVILAIEPQAPVAPAAHPAPVFVPGGAPLPATAPAILPVAPPKPAPAGGPRPVKRVPQPQATPPVFRPASFQAPVEGVPLDETPADEVPTDEVPTDEPPAAVLDADAPKMPTGAPPALQTASLSDDGGVNISSRTSFDNMISIMRPHGKDDGEADGEQVPVTLVQRHETIVTTTYPVEMVSAKTVDGRAVTGEILKKFLKTGRMVAVSTDGEPVDPFWLQNLKPLTVVVVVPPAMGYGHGHGVIHAHPAPAIAPPPPADVPGVELPQALPVPQSVAPGATGD